MVSKKKKEVKVDSLVLDGFAVEKLKRFVEDKAENVPSLLLHCIQLQDGVQQIHCIKKHFPATDGQLKQPIDDNNCWIMDIERKILQRGCKFCVRCYQIVPLLEDLHISSADTDMLYCCLNVLAKMYFSVASKNPLKKALASSLNGLSDRCTAAAAPVFIRCMKEDIESEDLGHYRKAVDNLASCMESFNLGTACVESLFVEILQFLVKVLHTFQSQNKKVLGNGLAQTQLMHDLLTAVKFSMVLVQKVQEPIRTALRADDRSPLWKTMCDLLSCFTEIIMDEDLLQNVQSTSGMAVILYLKTMFEDGEKLPKLVSDVVLGSLDPDAVPGWFMSSCGSRCKDLSDTAMLFLCQGSLAMLGWKNGSMGDSGDKLLLDLLSTLLTLSSRLKESSTAMFLSRTLALWTSSALDVLRSCSSDLKPSLRGSSAACGKLLEYVYIHWEHPLDAIRHQTKVIFKNLLQIHKAAVSEKDEAEDLFLSELTHKLLDLEWHSKGKYASLACLVECVGAEQILAVDQSIPVQILDVMGDQSFAPYASNLLEAMFVNHKNQLMTKNGENSWIDQWHDAWVSPLLLRLCEGEINQTTYIIDYYLPKLLKCSLASLNYMIEILRSSATTNVGSANNRGALGALMACLRTARSHGHIRFTENYVWSGVVSVSLIQQGLVHIHDQVRVDALGLLCESHWTTEVVSLDEMNLVLFFLKYNLNCQSPSVRQQLCYLMRKLFCRIQESSQALCKHEQSKNLKRSAEEKACALDPSAALQQYREFMTSVANYLFESLFPGSSHPTRFSALTILGSIAEIFPVEGSCQAVFALARSVSGNNVRALLECFSNTFEEVKNLAFELLRKLPPSVLGLEDPKKLSILLEAALNLSTSTKHFDCVTASYLLNFLIYQEGLQTALENRIQNRHRPSALPNPKASLVEKNTYSVVRLLMGSLENEILQAERSLLEAAASFPLYGRVHCVSGVLRQLSLKDLSMVAEWRQLISELISMSYRLSEVVSPVVHSSSPEGLMPMDNDTEAATQLHMIMSEIQPRDTNDYFAQPRTLQKENDPLYQLLPEDGVPSDSLCAETKGKDGPSCNVSAQMVLVCCWRSMKEVSLLLGMLCQNLPLQDLSDSACGLVTVEQVKEMGEYFKHHLLQSRHRGAFELAYVGFVKLTEMLIGCTEESLRCLPCQWLCNVLEEIKSSDPSSKLCATRRSAGIPFYIQALLASEPKNSKAGLLKMTMKELIHLALPASDPSGNTSTIPQVHALNILRALFRDTRLGENIIPYVGEGTRAAILGFTSPVWAVRNSSTLLFSTLITRIFGVKRGKDERSKKNRMTGREFFSRFPTLYPFLLEHLEVVANTVDRDTGESKLHPSLFLLLLILSKLYPSPMDGTYSALSMAPFIPFIIRCGHSPVYRSREMASRALVPFCMINDIPQTALELLKSLPDSSNEGVKQNRIHGTLLQVLHLMHSFFEAKHTANSERIKQEVCDLILCLKAKVWLAKRQNPCLITRAAFIDLLTLFINYLGKSKSQDVSGFTDDIADVLEECGLREGACHTHAVPGHVLYMQSVAQLVLSVLSVHVTGGSTDTDRSKTGDLDFPGLIQHMLTSDFHEVRLLSLQSLLQWVTLSPSAASYVHLSLDIEKTLCQMITKETNSECLCQVLKICYELDAKKILLMAKNHFHVEARDFLQLIVELASTRSHSLDIQSSALKLSSKLVIRLVAESQEAPESDLRDWIALLVHSCEVEVQTENKMAAAEVLINTAPYLLLCQRPVLALAVGTYAMVPDSFATDGGLLNVRRVIAGAMEVMASVGLSETLNLWKCVVQLLQCEDQDVRDTAADIIRVAQRSSLSGSVFPFCAVNPPKALDLTLCVLCEMLRRWDRVPDGVLVLTEWLLDEDDLSDLQTAKSVEDDFLFEKGEANFWAEKLLYVRLLSTHLRKLISATSCSLPSARLRQLSSGVSEHCDRTERSIEGLPPSPEFLKTSEYTRLLIQKERTSKCMEILSLIQKQMNKDMH